MKASLSEVEELLPDQYLKEYKIPGRQQAIREIHQPSSKVGLKHARRRWIYEELLLFQLKMQWIQKRKQKTDGRARQKI